METTLSDNEHSDNLLFQDFCSDRTNAVKKIYQKGFAGVRKMVKKNGGNLEDAEDVFQEGILVLYGYCQQEEFRLTTRLAGFLYSICRNLWRKKLEKKGRSGITFYDIEEYVKMNTVLKLENEEVLQVHRMRLLFKHLARLPEKEQKVLRLYYLEGKSHREVAQELGYASESSARVQKFRYLNHLKSLVRQDPDFE